MKRIETPEDAPRGPVLEEERTRDSVERTLAGDATAFRALVEAHERAVFGLCRRLLHGNEAEAEDLAQETFLRAYKYLDRLEDRNRFSPWLYQIARSLCRDRRRRFEVERRALAERADALREAYGASIRQASSRFQEGEVPSVLDELPPEERHALSLRYFEGLSYEEIAARIGLRFSQVDHLIRKARARLSRRMTVRQRDESK